MDRCEIVHENFLRRVAAKSLPEGRAPAGPMTAEQAVAAYRAACLTRVLDRQSRAMQRAGQGFYTIGSSGHEAMAAVALALRPTDMAFLHYRDAAFQIARAGQVPGQNPTWDMLLSFASSAEDPISGGRHKVLGSRTLMIPPQTSTIASHLPKAVGAAYSVAAARRHRPEHALLPDDALVMCSFGDASANHSTSQGAFNTAQWTSYQSIPLPLLFVCEDNGIGISTKTPKGWIEATFSARPGLRYFKADGLDLFDTYRVAVEAANWVRARRKPAFLHLGTIRLYGHAGADMPTTYLSREEVEAEEAQDPLLHAVRLMDQAGVMSPDQALSIYLETGERVARVAADAVKRPRLVTAAEVMASLIPPRRVCRPTNGPTPEARATAFGADLKIIDEPQIMSRLINWTLTDLMLAHPEIVMMGEDVGRKGGVYGVTQKLHARFGADRMIDTLLDEQSILGLAIGMAQNGFVPLPEIQFLAYLHNAEDQLRGEAATLSYFSNGQFTNPMVLRIAGLGYQKGFGGHFHNDNSVAVLRDIPGVILAVPSNGADAAMMLRECVRLAREEQRVVVFLEPIALYPMRDLHADKDAGWMRRYPDPSRIIPLGEVGVEGDGADLAIVTFGNGVYLSQQALPEIAAAGISARIIDLRWLSPLPKAGITAAVAGCAHVLVVDETRHSGGVAEAVMAHLAETCQARLARITAEDSFIATGPAYAATMPSRGTIVAAALRLAGGAGMTKAVVICPGRGTYNAKELGYLSRHFPDAALLGRFEAVRAAAGQEPLAALDGAASFAMSRHGRGDNASALIYAASYGDFLSLPASIDVVAVTGNSMGWYTALACAGAVAGDDGFTIANTMGRLMTEAMIGGQIVHPWMGEDWVADPARRAGLLALVASIAARPGHRLALSIELGGMLVVAGNTEGLKAFEAEVAPVGTRFPMRLANHAAFHTDLQAPVAAAGQAALPETLFRHNRLPLIDGRGHVWWPGSAGPAALRAYTLGQQVTETYDFTAAIRSATREFAPDLFIVTGPGATLSNAVAQSLVLADWHDTTDRESFERSQQGHPSLISMGDAESRGSLAPDGS